MNAAIEKTELAGLSDLLISDQLFVDVAAKKLYVFVNRKERAGLRKDVDHSDAYRRIFGNRKIFPNEAMLIFWHNYGLETSNYQSNDDCFTLLVGEGRPRFN